MRCPLWVISGQTVSRHEALKFGRRRSNRRAKPELCPGYERSSRHSLCKDTVFLDLVL
jgi:hypothetical protein